MAPLDSPSIYYSARRFDAVNSIDRAPANTADIVASGALIWRMRDGALEVLIIHRPRYDDWSWPKGKQDPGESWLRPLFVRFAKRSVCRLFWVCPWR